MDSETAVDEMNDFHKKCAVSLFNGVWDLMEKQDRTPDETDAMIHMAHASRYHWEQVGTAVNLSRGEWQIARVYAIAGRPEPALYHANRNLEICLSNQIGDFDLAYAYEGLARAYFTAEDHANFNLYYEKALQASNLIEQDTDKQLLLDDMKQLQTTAEKLG
ncbi:hypothetical protein RFW18_00755 [Metabacillus idriensis]|uniref:hypothetical protein n=1 Tax=Metabacillus idriensis TaxID=324768 RepID=UPI002812D8DE|nr:hypothetical protein [Metabacillus idriensis]MDR0136255.1 hypothetical protein [Metabacillus idriensis]